MAAGGVVYTGGGNQDSGILEAWQPATGKKLWSYTAKDSMGHITVVPGSRVLRLRRLRLLARRLGPANAAASLDRPASGG